MIQSVLKSRRPGHRLFLTVLDVQQRQCQVAIQRTTASYQGQVY